MRDHSRTQHPACSDTGGQEAQRQETVSGVLGIPAPPCGPEVGCVMGSDGREIELYNTVFSDVLKIWWIALAGVVQWTECRLVNQRVTCSIPSQGTCLGCEPGPQ